MTVHQSHFRFSDRVCAVCARPATCLGWVPANNYAKHPIAWLCDDAECVDIIARTYSMKQLEFSRIDSLATQEAGAALEGFCDKIGKSDLRDLTQAEFDSAMMAVIAAYRDALKTKLRDEAPF
ncbi:MAG TPA: hypothetical protein VFT69_17080 [Pseudolabrys sp.]|nr:hypothetical protein [Pseudolabrys sp.]